MRSFDGENFVMMPVPASMFGVVCAALAGASVGAVAAANTSTKPAATPAPTPATGETAPAAAVEASTGATAGAAAPDVSGEVDAGGHPWSADLHAATKTKTAAGLWRMKVGAARPDPLPGSPAASAPAAAADASATAGGAASVPSAPAAPADDVEDEFAAFREAAAKSDAASGAAAASVVTRKWTDADLAKLCNQGAVKLGDPAPVKAIIAEFSPEGVPAHSRNIPEDKREDFAKAIEAKAGITFEG